MRYPHVKLCWCGFSAERDAEVGFWRNRGGAGAGRRSSSTGNLVRSGAGVGEGELGEDFGPTAERRQCLAVAEVLRNAEYTAAQCGFRSKLQEAVVARV